MRFEIISLIALAASAIAVPLGFEASPLPPSIDPPTAVTIGALTYGGTGCPQNTASVLVASDKKSFSVIFDQYAAEVTATVHRKRLNCQLALQMKVPQGFSFTLTTVNYRGFVALDKGVVATQTSSYFFDGIKEQATRITTLNGPINKPSYVLSDDFDISAVVFSNCGATAPLNINSAISIENTKAQSATGLITTDSIDGSFETKFSFRWARC